MGLFKTDPQANEKKALAEANEALAANPNDVRALVKAADAQQKLRQTQDAARLYARAAERFVEEGFGLKGIAMNKVAYGLLPHPTLLERESHYYKELDMLPDAFEALKKAAPERMLWATNWPHPMPNTPIPDDAWVLDMMLEWIPDETMRRKAFVDNPARLYGF